MPESLTHLELATTLDPQYYIGYNSLSAWHLVNNDADKSNEINLRLANVLATELATPIDPTLESYKQYNLRWAREKMRDKLGAAYNAISRFHAKAGRDTEAIEWVRKACVVDDYKCGVTILTYIDFLGKLKVPDGQTEALRLLRLLEAQYDRGQGSGTDALTGIFYHTCTWAQKDDETWWRFVAQAAKDKGELDWLVGIWEDVVEVARTISHKAVFRAKVVLLCLYRDYVKDAEKASVLAVEVGVLVRTWCVSGRMDIEKAKEVFGF
jgi:hypothetical protein